MSSRDMGVLLWVILSFVVTSYEMEIEYSLLDRRLVAIEKLLIRDTNARRDLGKKVEELSAQLENKIRLRISLQLYVANLTSELQREKEERQELQLQLTNCHDNGSQNIDENSLLLLLQDNKQQIKMLNEIVQNVTDSTDVIQRQYHNLSSNDMQYEISIMNSRNQHLRETFNNMTKEKYYEFATMLMYDDAKQHIHEVEEYAVEFKKNETNIRNNIRAEMRQVALSVQDFTRFLGNINASLVDLHSPVELLDTKMSVIQMGFAQDVQTSNMTSPNIESSVLFSATLQKPRLTNVPIYNAVPFNNLITSYGEGFNTDDGKFTANIPGYYIFQWEIQTRPRSLCDSALAKVYYDARLLSTAADGRADATSSQSSSNLLVLLLRRNDKVWIESGRCDHIYGEELSSFTGWKIG